jgi:hypothetical protein
MSDYHVKITVKNGRILRLMRDCGFSTMASLSRVAGISPAEAGLILNMRKAPMKKNGQWSESVLRMAAALRCDPDDMFTEAQSTMALKLNSAESFMDEGNMLSLIAGDIEENQWAKIETQRLLSVLKPRERAIIEATIMEGATLDDADPDECSRERVRQLQMKAIRKMKRAAALINSAGDNALAANRPIEKPHMLQLAERYL